MGGRRFGIVLAVVLIFGGVLALSADWSHVPFPWQSEKTFYTVFALCKCKPNDFVTTSTVKTYDKLPSQSYDLWFGTETFVRVTIVSPLGEEQTFTSEVVDVDMESCPTCIYGKNPPAQVRVSWQAWEGDGEYTLKYTTMKKTGEDCDWLGSCTPYGDPMISESYKVTVGGDATFPQQHK